MNDDISDDKHCQHRQGGIVMVKRAHIVMVDVLLAAWVALTVSVGWPKSISKRAYTIHSQINC